MYNLMGDESVCAYCEHPITLDSYGVGRSNLTWSCLCDGDVDGLNDGEVHVPERWHRLEPLVPEGLAVCSMCGSGDPDMAYHKVCMEHIGVWPEETWGEE